MSSPWSNPGGGSGTPPATPLAGSIPLPPFHVPGSGPWARRDPEPEPGHALPDEPIEPAEARRKRWAGRIVRIDFRGAMRSNARRTAFIVIALTLCAMAIGGLAAFAVTGGKADRVTLAAAALAVGAASLVSAAFSLHGADHRVLEGQGALEITGTESGETGRASRRLYNVTAEMALAAGLPMPRVYLLDEAGLNAFAVGRDPSRAAVAATRGLVEALSRDELQAVMAHEMGHIAGRDTRLMVTAAATAGLVFLVVDILGNVMRNSDSRRLGAAAGLAFLAAWAIAVLVVPVLNMALSRQREYMAGANAAKFTRNPAALASALERISENPHVEAANHSVAPLYILNPCAGSFLDGLMSTHPPVERRIARLIDLKAD